MRLRSLMGALGAWRDRRRVLAELATLKREAAPTDNLATDTQLQQAKVALERLDMRQAELLWAKAKASNLTRAQASPDGLNVVLGLRRFDEADKLMADGMKRSPRNSFFFEGYAQVAQSRLDYSEAVKRWQNVRRKFPMHPAGYYSGAHCLTELARFDEAHSILTQALQRFPNDFQIRMEHARLATARGDLPEALNRWMYLDSGFQHPLGVVGMAKALTGMKRFEEAEKTLADARLRFPIEPMLVIELAYVARACGNAEKELRYWQTVRERFPMIGTGYAQGCKFLNDLGRFNEADTILRDAIGRFKFEAWPLVQYAWNAHSRQDWSEAVERWCAVRAAFPDRQEAYQRGAEALRKSGQDEAAAELLAIYEGRRSQPH